VERLRSLTLAAAVLGLAPGCIHVHTDANGKMKSVELKATASGTDPEVKPASASVPATTPEAKPAAPSALAKLAPLLTGGSAPAAQPVDFYTTWNNKLGKLADPTKNGAFGTGLVGQMFLFGAGTKSPPVPADGKLTVELYDESPRPGVTEPRYLGSWTFQKEQLRLLAIQDERFGKCYALFLPWPDYRPDFTRVRLMSRFEPENGYTLYAPPTTMVIDNTVGEIGTPTVTRSTTFNPPGPLSMPSYPAPSGPAPGGFPTPPSGPGAFPAGPTGPGAFPVAPSGPVGPTAGGPPPGLPPIAITLPSR
jgi:hypothetical protein